MTEDKVSLSNRLLSNLLLLLSSLPVPAEEGDLGYEEAEVTLRIVGCKFLSAAWFSFWAILGLIVSKFHSSDVFVWGFA